MLWEKKTPKKVPRTGRDITKLYKPSKYYHLPDGINSFWTFLFNLE